jgi:polar amino acid transport system substrate-binding protein
MLFKEYIMKKGLIALLVIVFGAGILFWVRQLKKPKFYEIPEKIVIGTSADFPPMSYKENRDIVGFDIDVTKEVFRRLNKKYEIKDMPFSLLVTQLQAGTIHVIAAGMTPTEARKKQVSFSEPYLTQDPLLVISRSQFTPQSIDDLKGKTVIVNQGYTADLYVSQIPDITIKRLPTVSDALLALRSGRGDAFVTASSTAKPIFDQHDPDTFHYFAIDDVNENAALGIAKAYPLLKDKIDTVLGYMEKDGTLKQFKEKWRVQ